MGILHVFLHCRYFAVTVRYTPLPEECAAFKGQVRAAAHFRHVFRSCVGTEYAVTLSTTRY